MNYEKLRSIIDNSGVTIKSLAEKMNIVRPTLHRKLKGEGAWTVNDVVAIQKALRLTDEEVRDIFLS